MEAEGPAPAVDGVRCSVLVGRDGLLARAWTPKVTQSSRVRVTPGCGITLFFKFNFLFLERGEGREKEKERNVNERENHQSVASYVCPDRESNWRSSSLQDDVRPAGTGCGITFQVDAGKSSCDALNWTMANSTSCGPPSPTQRYGSVTVTVN